VHGAPYRFSDPARFSIAHGGKDRHPYPVPLKVYDRTIDVLKIAVHRARLGQSEELAAIRRVGSSGTSPGLQSRRCSRRSVRARINMAAEAYLAPSCRPLRPRGKQESASGEGKAALVS
jgi:hypothetical protein